MEDKYTPEQIERFWRNVKKTNDPNGCWVWTGTKFGGGYGQFSWIIRKKRRFASTHRVAFEITFGEIPERLVVCHTCDNPSCVNPYHLFLGTPKDNTNDMIQKGRAIHQSHEENGRSKLTEVQVEEIRRRYIPRIVTTRMLAKEFGVTSSVISDVVNYKTWK